jgi:leucyl/phenylalanyl-tRNA--protein transferase
MFSRVDDASGVAFVILAEQLARWDIGLIDCQVETRHLARFGARSVPRESFIELLRSAIRKPTRRGRWVLAPQEGEVLESDSGHAAPDDQHKGSVIPNS